MQLRPRRIERKSQTSVDFVDGRKLARCLDLILAKPAILGRPLKAGTTGSKPRLPWTAPPIFIASASARMATAFGCKGMSFSIQAAEADLASDFPTVLSEPDT